MGNGKTIETLPPLLPQFPGPSNFRLPKFLWYCPYFSGYYRLSYDLFPASLYPEAIQVLIRLAETKLPRKRGSCCIYPHSSIPHAAGDEFTKDRVCESRRVGLISFNRPSFRNNRVQYMKDCNDA